MWVFWAALLFNLVPVTRSTIGIPDVENAAAADGTPGKKIVSGKSVRAVNKFTQTTVEQKQNYPSEHD